jgi:uncharacterized protein YeeX (DUF496 family)
MDRGQQDRFMELGRKLRDNMDAIDSLLSRLGDYLRNPLLFEEFQVLVKAEGIDPFIRLWDTVQADFGRFRESGDMLVTRLTSR